MPLLKIEMYGICCECWGVNPSSEDNTNTIDGEQYQDEFRISSQFPAKYQKI